MFSRSPSAKQDADDREVAGVPILVHEMDFQRGRFAFDRMLAGRVEVELQQVVGDAVVDDMIAGVGVHLNRMPVVEDFVGGLAVVEFDSDQIGLDGVADVDWRLRLAFAAQGELRRQLEPIAGTSFAFVTPSDFVSHDSHQ